MYLTDNEGNHGDYYIYDSQTGDVYYYTRIETNMSYVILQPDESVEIPQGYVETQVTIDGRSVKAWMPESGEETGFYLVYAMDNKGNKGFYTYDSMEDTLQRFTERVVVIEVEPEEEAVETADLVEQEQEPGIIQRLFNIEVIKIVIIALAIILIALIAILFISSRRHNSGKYR